MARKIKESVRIEPDVTTEEKAAQVLASQGAGVEAGDAAEAPKRRRGRPPGSGRKNAAPAIPEKSAEEIRAEREQEARDMVPLIHMAANGLGRLLAGEQAEGWYTEDDALRFAQAAVPLAHKYGDRVMPYKEELAFVAVASVQGYALYKLRAAAKASEDAAHTISGA